jgi:zinc D-Ala-D-Ala carboxypeptidase
MDDTVRPSLGDMDPLAAVQARVSAIEARFDGRAPLPVGGDFAAVLTATPAGPHALPLGSVVALEGAGGIDRSTAVTSFGTTPSRWGAADVLQLGLTPAAVRAPGQYPRLSPPPELVGYGNGRVPAEALQAIDGTGNHRLWAPAAQAFRSLEAAANAAGIRIGVTDSYRPLAVQERLAREKGLFRDGGLAAVPGTSNHGWGLSLDLDLDASAQSWMRENAWRYGFVEDVPREPWHWTYRPAGRGS